MLYIPQTKTFNGKKYRLYMGKDLMNIGRAKNTAAQIRLEGAFARIVSFMQDGQASYLVYYRRR